MAAGSIKLQSNDTRIATVTFEDGAAGNVSVVVPKEGGVLASEGYAVAKSGEETIAGIKTFSSSPIVPTPTTDMQASNKGYVDAFPLSGTIQGIKVGNTSVADATTLDWYEEGTFTPTIVGFTTAGVGTYTIQTGSYTRIGDTVVAHVRIATTAHTGTGQMQISGFPFVIAGSRIEQIIAGFNLTITGSVYIESISNATSCFLYALNNGVVTPLNMDVACALVFTAIYKA